MTRYDIPEDHVGRWDVCDYCGSASRAWGANSVDWFYVSGMDKDTTDVCKKCQEALPKCYRDVMAFHEGLNA